MGSYAEPACDDDPSRRLHQQDLRRTLDAALARLTPKIRSTFVLFAEVGLSYKEIAETLVISTRTAETPGTFVTIAGSAARRYEPHAHDRRGRDLAVLRRDRRQDQCGLTDRLRLAR